MTYPDGESGRTGKPRLTRPVPIFDPAKGLLNNEHFQIGYVTNDLDRAARVFRERFGVREFRANDNELPGGARIGIRAAWIGNMMYEVCCGAGPGMELYTKHAPQGGEFVLRFHHFGYLLGGEADWDALEAEIVRGGWQIAHKTDVPGFVRACYIDVPELGHYLEFVLPREGLIDRMNETPGS